MVDPAYDLAGASCEFSLPERAVERLVDVYARKSGDRAIARGCSCMRLLYGVVTMRRACGTPRPSLERSSAGVEPAPSGGPRLPGLADEPVERRVPRDRRDRAGPGGCSSWTWTACSTVRRSAFRTRRRVAWRARLLRAHDVRSVLNTGRDRGRARYCRAYGLAGGLGEFGSVFVDTVADASWR